MGVVTLANLRMIRDVAHARSVSKTARMHGLSQSAVSQLIQEAEREAGVELFDRGTRPLGVTAAGKVYLEFCRDVLRRQEELEAALGRLKQQANGTARLASIYSVGLSEMVRIERRFRERFPEAELNVSYLRPERVWEAVADDQADLGLMSYAESSREIVALPWREEEMVVATAPNHRLAARESVAIEAIEGEAFVGFDDDLPIERHIERYLREHKVTVDIALRFDNLQMIKEAVAHGAGVSIMPRRVLRDDLAHGRMAALTLAPAELYRPVRIIHRRRKTFNAVTSGLLALLQESEERAAEDANSDILALSAT